MSYDCDIYIIARSSNPLAANQIYSHLIRYLAELGFFRTDRPVYKEGRLRCTQGAVNKDIEIFEGSLAIPPNHDLSIWFEAKPHLNPGAELLGNMLNVELIAGSDANTIQTLFIEGIFPDAIWRNLDRDPYRLIYQKLLRLCDMLAGSSEFESITMLRALEEEDLKIADPIQQKSRRILYKPK